MTDKQELLPCPFCGELSEIEHMESGRWTVGCADETCIGYQPIVSFSRQAEAIAAWNHRTPDPELAKVTAERDEARRDFAALEHAIVGAAGLSAITVASELRALLVSRTTAIEAAIEAMEPFAEAAGEGNEDFPDKTPALIPVGRSEIYSVVLGDLVLGDFRRVASVRTELRSLIAGKETDVG